MRGTVEARFWSKVFKHESGCWDWLGALSWSKDKRRPSCYGRFWDGERLSLAHRYSYILAHGSIKEGLQIDHLCKNTRCVNPAHLEAVTSRENNLRSEAVSAKHAVKTHCPAGHAYDEGNTYVDAKGSRHCRACRANRRFAHQKSMGVSSRTSGRYKAS